MWQTSVEFPFPVTLFTKKGCKTLQRVFTGPFLAKMGVFKTTSWALVFAQYQYSSFSIANTWAQQGLQHLYFLLGHLSNQDKLGNLLKIYIDMLQLIIALPDPPLTYSLPSYINPCPFILGGHLMAISQQLLRNSQVQQSMVFSP